jgi:hypothetical protein
MRIEDESNIIVFLFIALVWLANVAKKDWYIVMDVKKPKLIDIVDNNRVLLHIHNPRIWFDRLREKLQPCHDPDKH